MLLQKKPIVMLHETFTHTKVVGQSSRDFHIFPQLIEKKKVDLSGSHGSQPEKKDDDYKFSDVQKMFAVVFGAHHQGTVELRNMANLSDSNSEELVSIGSKLITHFDVHNIEIPLHSAGKKFLSIPSFFLGRCTRRFVPDILFAPPSAKKKKRIANLKTLQKKKKEKTPKTCFCYSPPPCLL